MKLAFAVLLIFTLPVQAEELSPWFGSGETAPFQLQIATTEPSSGVPAKEAITELLCGASICPDTRKLAIMGTQDLAAAP